MVPTGRGAGAAGGARPALARRPRAGASSDEHGERQPFASPEHILFGVSLLPWMQWMADQPWSIGLRESLFVWPLLESAHVLTLMLFVGTAAMLDLRLLGLTFRTVPASEFTGRLLPWTRASFALMAVTGVLLVLRLARALLPEHLLPGEGHPARCGGPQHLVVPRARAPARAGLGSDACRRRGRPASPRCCRSWPGPAWSSPGGWWPTTGSTAICSPSRRSSTGPPAASWRRCRSPSPDAAAVLRMVRGHRARTGRA